MVLYVCTMWSLSLFRMSDAASRAGYRDAHVPEATARAKLVFTLGGSGPYDISNHFLSPVWGFGGRTHTKGMFPLSCFVS